MVQLKHYEKVNTKEITSAFSSDKEHRFYLSLPFVGRENQKKVFCVIGQNPSYADNEQCDKTVYYIEHLIYDKFPDVKKIVFLNLFSRVDTRKNKTGASILLPAAREIHSYAKNDNTVFLIIYGKLTKKKGIYKFKKRAMQIKAILKFKKVYKIGIKECYAPHPGNLQVFYGNYNVNIVPYNFEDV